MKDSLYICLKGHKIKYRILGEAPLVIDCPECQKTVPIFKHICRTQTDSTRTYQTLTEVCLAAIEGFDGDIFKQSPVILIASWTLIN